MSDNGFAVRNASIITMNPHQPRAEALAVREGRIAAVGAWADVAPHAGGVPVLDLAGKAVLPGFIDTHAHFLWTALSLAALDLSEAEHHLTLQSTVRQAVAGTAPDELILGMGFTEYALDTERFRPIIGALEALALPEHTPGVTRDAGGLPNGLLADEANNRALSRLGGFPGEDDGADEWVALAVGQTLSVGLTIVHTLEGGSVSEDRAVIQFLNSMPGLPLRFVLYYQTMDVDKVVGLGLPRIGGCVLLDGDVGPRTAALSEPYVDDPTCYGTL